MVQLKEKAEDKSSALPKAKAQPLAALQKHRENSSDHSAAPLAASHSDSRNSLGPPDSQLALAGPEVPLSKMTEAPVQNAAQTAESASPTEPPKAASSKEFPPHIFIFSNPTSGGNKAAAFTKSTVSRITLGPPTPCEVHFFDIRQGSSGQKEGFLRLKEVTDEVVRRVRDRESESLEESIVRVLVAGGDGTVMWCLSEMKTHGVVEEACAIGIVPYGTGNDFANAFGWRAYNAVNPFDGQLHTLKALIASCLNASVVLHDLWQVDVNLKTEGTFSRINTKTKAKDILRESDGCPTKRLRFTMCNYFSLGVESRIGAGFERHRTASQVMNKVRYGIEGLKKALFRRTRPVNEVLNALVLEGDGGERVLFDTDKAEAVRDKAPLLKKCASLVALNIPSFSGGNDVWGPAKNLAVRVQDKTQFESLKGVLKERQITGDGKLEFIAFPSIHALGVEFMLHGRGGRLHSGHGPWRFVFRALRDDTRVYFQVDGEFFQARHVENISICHDRKVKVLSLKKDDIHHTPFVRP